MGNSVAEKRVRTDGLFAFLVFLRDNVKCVQDARRTPNHGGTCYL